MFGFVLGKMDLYLFSSEKSPAAHPGAQNRIRTGDLVLTKDVLYQLSYLGITRKWSKNEKRSGDRDSLILARQLHFWAFSRKF